MKEWVAPVLLLCVVAIRQAFQVSGTLREMKDQDQDQTPEQDRDR